MANLIRGLSENGGVVFCGVDSTELVRRAEQLHTTSATCSAALGRLLTGASLMGSMLKDDGDKVTLRVQGGGPAGVLIACTDGTGNVKGCIDNPLVELPPKADGHLDVGGAVGRSGVLTVIRDNRLQKEPTVGQVPLVSGEIAEDLTRYYATSEQIPTVCALGVLVDKDLSILSAGEGAGVHGPDELLAPQQQRNKQRQPGPQPGAAQQRTQPKKQPQTLFYPQTHMPLPGQSGQRAVMPGGTARPESAGQRYNAGQVQPCLCGMAQQGVSAAALRGEFYRGPETNGFHDGLLSGRCPVGRCPVAVCSVV